jgi:hypothetical protein
MEDQDTFFQHMYAADEDDRDSDGPEYHVVENFLRKSKKRKLSPLPKMKPARLHNPGNNEPSSSDLTQMGAIRRTSSYPEEMSKLSNPPALKTYSSAPPRSTNIMPRGRGKRRKITDERKVPQIFSGTSICEIPLA